MGSLGDSDNSENGGLNSPTYAAPPKWECPPTGIEIVIERVCLRLGLQGAPLHSDCFLIDGFRPLRLLHRSYATGPR